jgi:formylglycine-generating enzyme required for sulfatase activity
MSSNFRRFPHVAGGLLALTAPRLRELAANAGLSLKDVPKFPGAIAGALRDRLASPLVLRDLLTPADLDAIGERLGIGKRRAWKKNSDLSYDEAVLARLFEEQQPAPAPEPARSRRDPGAAAGWPALASLSAWAGLDVSRREEVAQLLASALGGSAAFLGFTGPHKLARLQVEPGGGVFVAIPGGRFSMGLGDAEKQALARLTKSWSEEARMHVRDLAEISRPVHAVDIPPFLCAETPVRISSLKDPQSAMTAGGHQVCLFEAAAAAAFSLQSGCRLLTEAEWEFIARAGVSRSWLCGDLNPEFYTSKVLSEEIEKDDSQPFGIHGLGWGSWVEDSWHRSYQNAPQDGSAWEPHQLPEVARGGGFLSWPWQVDGEALLLHAAHRERSQSALFPILLALDLPPSPSV